MQVAVVAERLVLTCDVNWFRSSRILKLVAKPMATFTLLIKCTWSKADGFQSIVDDDATTDSGNGGEEEEDEDAEME